MHKLAPDLTHGRRCFVRVFLIGFLGRGAEQWFCRALRSQYDFLIIFRYDWGFLTLSVRMILELETRTLHHNSAIARILTTEIALNLGFGSSLKFIAVPQPCYRLRPTVRHFTIFKAPL